MISVDAKLASEYIQYYGDERTARAILIAINQIRNEAFGEEDLNENVSHVVDSIAKMYMALEALRQIYKIKEEDVDVVIEGYQNEIRKSFVLES